MDRIERYPDTDTFHWFNANPKKRLTTDCVVRAISVATQESYARVLKQLVEAQLCTGYDFSDPRCFNSYLEGLGWKKHKQPRKADGGKYTGIEFCRLLQDYDAESEIPKSWRGRYVANIGTGHTVAIVNGLVWDTWDSTGGCIGNYWYKL